MKPERLGSVPEVIIQKPSGNYTNNYTSSHLNSMVPGTLHVFMAHFMCLSCVYHQFLKNDPLSLFVKCLYF